MTNSRKENLRLLRLAMNGKLKPEDLVHGRGSITITMYLNCDPKDQAAQERAKRLKGASVKGNNRAKRIGVTLNLS